MKSKQAYNSDDDRVWLTEAGSAALLAQANMRLMLRDIGAELAAIVQEAEARGEGHVPLHELGRVWLLVRCGQIMADMEDEPDAEPEADLPPEPPAGGMRAGGPEPPAGRDAGWWAKAIGQVEKASNHRRVKESQAFSRWQAHPNPETLAALVSAMSASDTAAEARNAQELEWFYSN